MNEPRESASTLLEIHRKGGVVCVSFPMARADGVAARELYETAVQLTNSRGVKLLVDFSGVPVISSGAMGMLVTVHKKFLQCGGQLHVVVPEKHVRKPFELMNLHLVLKIFGDVSEGLGQFK